MQGYSNLSFLNKGFPRKGEIYPQGVKAFAPVTPQAPMKPSFPGIPSSAAYAQPAQQTPGFTAAGAPVMPRYAQQTPISPVSPSIQVQGAQNSPIGGAGIGTAMDGPFDIFLAFANSLLPLGVTELYLRTGARSRPAARSAVAVVLATSAIVILVGSAGAWLMMWRPYL